MIDTITLRGRLVRDAELRFTGQGDPVASFTIAASDSKKNEMHEWENVRELFMPCVVFNSKQAQWATHVGNLQKGTPVTVVGKLYTNKWEAKDGSPRSRVEMLCYEAHPTPTEQLPPNQTPDAPNRAWEPQEHGGFSNQTQGPAQDQPPF